MTKELITPKNYSKVKRKLEELLIRSWKMSRPLSPRMRLAFKVFPEEHYFSTVGLIFWVTPFWRGDVFTVSILLHEMLHWSIFPVDVFRSLKEIFQARRLLAEELSFKPRVIQKSMWHREEDWTRFRYSIQELQFVQNILGDYLVNLAIYDNYPTIWNDMWNFLSVEGTFYTKDKPLKRDTTFMLYLAVYPELIPSLGKIQLLEKTSETKVPKIAKIVQDCRAGRVSTVYALKELVKIFHENIMQDLKEEQQKGEGEGRDLRCPKCHSDAGWEIIAYKKGKSWVNV